MDTPALQSQLESLQARLEVLERRRRTRWTVLGVAAALLTSLAIAQPMSLITFTSNRPALASEINANFTYLDNRITALNSQLVPAGTVAFFAAATCPASWSEYTPARGRVVVALQAGGAVGGTQGTAYTNLESRQHLHQWSSFTGGGTAGREWFSYDITGAQTLVIDWSDGFTTTGSGNFALGVNTTAALNLYTANTNATPPTIQLLACRKN